MSKTITLRLDDEIYRAIKTIAEQEHRTLSNFIESAAIRYLEQIEFAGEFEMLEIESNRELKQNIIDGWNDYKDGRGEFV